MVFSKYFFRIHAVYLLPFESWYMMTDSRFRPPGGGITDRRDVVIEFLLWVFLDYLLKFFFYLYDSKIIQLSPLAEEDEGFGVTVVFDPEQRPQKRVLRQTASFEPLRVFFRRLNSADADAAWCLRNQRNEELQSHRNVTFDSYVGSPPRSRLKEFFTLPYLTNLINCTKLYVDRFRVSKLSFIRKRKGQSWASNGKAYDPRRCCKRCHIIYTNIITNKIDELSLSC